MSGYKSACSCAMAAAVMLFAIGAPAQETKQEPRQAAPESQKTSATAPAPASTPTAEPIQTMKPTKVVTSYDRRRVVRDGKEYFCKRQATTGSKLKGKELCLTKEEMVALQNAAQKLFLDNNNVPLGDSYQDGNGGVQIGPMPMSNSR